MRRALAGALAAAAVWGLLRGLPADPPPPPPPSPPTATGTRPPASPVPADAAPAGAPASTPAAPAPASADDAPALPGRVLAAASAAPVPGARVLAVRGDDGTVVLSRLARESCDRADADGRFRIVGLAPGRYTIGAAAEGFAPATAVVDLPRDAPLEIALGPEAALVVGVTGGDGAAGAGATVEVVFDGGGATWGRTGADGRARIGGLPPGRHDLRIFRAGAWSVMETVEVAAGATATRTIRLPGGDAGLSGTVTRAGRPAADRWIAVEWREAGGRAVRLEGRTDVDGRYAIGPLRPGPARLLLPGTPVDRRVEVRPGRTIADVALPALVLRLRVRDDATGDPLPGAQAVGRVRGRADEDGLLTWCDLPEGEVALVVLAGDHAPRRVRLVPGSEGAPPAEVRLGTGRLLTLRIEDDAGRPVPDADTTVRGPDGFPIGSWAEVRGGTMRLADAVYRIEVDHPDFEPARRTVELRGRDRVVTVRLRRR